MAGTECGFPWLGEVYQGPLRALASSSNPTPVHEMVTAPPETVGLFKCGSAPGFRARKVNSALGLDVSFIRILVLSGWMENHSKSAPPLEWPATRRNG